MASLPLRPGRRAAAWLASEIVRPPGVELGATGRPRIYIAPLDSRVDRRILNASLASAGLPLPRWVPSRRAHSPEQEVRASFLDGDPVLVPLAHPRSGPDRLARLLAWACEQKCEVDLVPLEVLWGPIERPPSLWNVLLGNPYEPPAWRRWLPIRRAGRVRVIVGMPGRLTDLRSEAPRPDDALALSTYVRGQAIKALSQTQRQVMGDRYKVPKLVADQILRQPEFRDRVAAAGGTQGLTRPEAVKHAEKGLRELVTGHDAFAMEVFRRFTRWLYTKVYDPEIAFEPDQLERLRRLGRRSPLVFVPSHKSNFDHLCLYYLLFSSGFPPPHTAAGINMAFFPMSVLLPRTGAYFIRRSFADDPIYKECLRSSVAYLVERRFHQEFFIEGGRTRTGKQLPPRYGMLHYIAEAGQASNVDDVCFIPTAIAYDQLVEVDEYVREQLGEEKQAESFGFLVRLIRSLRRRDLGRIYIRFGDPISLRDQLDRAGDDPLLVEKLAFQIANGINAITPMTAVAAVSSALLGAGRRALTLPELELETQRLIEYGMARGIFLGRELQQGPKVAVKAATDALRQSGVVDVYDGGIEPVYNVRPERRHIASYYRNTVVHFFLVRAIADLARRAETAERSAQEWALRMRTLLKFEFFFSERQEFLTQIEAELKALRREEGAGLPPFGAAGPRIVLDYLESYWVVTRTLRSSGAEGASVREPELLERCLAVGRQLLLQSFVDAPELLSRVNFRNALKLAENLGAARLGDDGYAIGQTRELDAMERDLAFLARVARS
jgi:glycerol-3-phosphate O-acyltransferase